MPTPPKPPQTHLGIAIRERRAERSQRDVGEAVGVPGATLSRIERGTHRPTYDTARAIATWLGWTVDEVMLAAEAPIETPAGETG